MNPAVLALHNPITTFMLVVALISGGALALNKMQVDIFPDLHVPKIYVFLQYGGMSPEQMEGFVVCQFELLFQYVDGVKEIKSRNIQQCSLVELSFHPDVDMAGALASVVAMANRAVSRMPPGTLPPMVMRMDEGSVPVGYLVLRGKTTPLGMVADYAQNIVRPSISANVPGTVAVSPFGPNVRSILVKCDPRKLQDYNLSPQDVTNALMTGNTVVPAGNVYVRDSMPMLPNNATVTDIKDIGKIPLKLGRNVYVRDVATVEDTTDLDYGYALVNRTTCCYVPIIKKSDASTLQVVADIRKSMDLFRSLVPRDVTVDFEFDESPTVIEAVNSVATEGMIGAGLTGLMILLFLQDWRSVIVVVCNIPLALVGALVGLWLSGNTINIMSLGGMALAIGILVDEATVTIENTHVQMEHTPKLATAVLRAANATAVARLLAMLCILSVFTPALVMQNPLHSLFMPLTMAVGFALISSYLLSSTLVPILSVHLLKHHAPQDEQAGLFGRFQRLFQAAVARFVAWRWVVVPAYVVGCGLVLWQVGGRLGTELFPQIDSGEFVLRFRPPPGSNYKLTRELFIKCLDEIDQEAGPDNVKISLGYAGQVAPNFGMNNMVLFMRGPDDGWMRVALREGSGLRLDEFRERLRKVLPDRLGRWMAQRLETGGLPRAEAEQQARTIIFGFQPGDMVSKVMSFGADADLGPRRRHRPRQHQGARQQGGRPDEAHPLPARRPVRAAAGLPLYPRRRRSREGGPERHYPPRCRRPGDRGELVQPVHRPELLALQQNRLRLSGRGPGAAQVHDLEVGGREAAADAGQPAGEPDDPRRGQGARDEDAWRDRPVVVAALHCHQRQRRGRGHGPRRPPGPASHRRRRDAAARRTGRDEGPGPAHGRHVQVAGGRPGGGGVRDLGAPDRLLPVAGHGAGFDQRRARRPRWRGDHPAGHGHVAEHRVVHGLDHVHRRVRVQLGHARDVHPRPLEGGRARERGGRHRRGRAPPADPDDRLCHDGRHGADGHGPGARQPDGEPAGPGGHRRPGHVHVRHPAGGAGGLRRRRRQREAPLAVALPRAPRKRPLRPGPVRPARSASQPGPAGEAAGSAPGRSALPTNPRPEIQP